VVLGRQCVAKAEKEFLNLAVGEEGHANSCNYITLHDTSSVMCRCCVVPCWLLSMCNFVCPYELDLLETSVKYCTCSDCLFSQLQLITSSCVVLESFVPSAPSNGKRLTLQCGCAQIGWSWYRRQLMLGCQHTRTIRGYLLPVLLGWRVLF